MRHLFLLATFCSLAGCGGPLLIIPGGELSGTEISQPIDNWSFVDSQFLELETRPENPRSVQLNYVIRDGKLYIDPAEGKTWLTHIRANPNVRVRFGNNIYPVQARLVGRPGELPGFDQDRFIYELVSRNG
ncbi:MAG: hypothetical protein AAF993_01325 [Pseudomonadota bacterium]